MKTHSLKNYFGLAIVGWFCAATAFAQQRTGGGGGGFGGFGGFGGGGFVGQRSGGSSGTTSAYNNNGTVGSATITVDPDTHDIVVIADEETSLQISNVIASLDAPIPQVLIKVVFLEVQHNNSLDIGVEGNYTGLNNNFSAITGYLTNYSVVTPSSGTSAGIPQIVPTSISPVQQSISAGNNFGLASAGNPQGLYQFFGSDFSATLRAIAQAGKSQVLSRPSVLARDGQLAQIVVGQEVYLPSGVAYASVGTSGATIPTINGSYQNVGIILNVTPFIGNNNLVQMILQPQTSELDTSTPGQIITYGSSLLGSSPVYAPNINIRSANTVVVTPDAQTVVIGGLISNSKSSSDSKIPLLGDIPVLGYLFKSAASANQKTELLMFLTPHIVDAPKQLGALAVRETGQSQLITNSISEQELDRFLERVPVKKAK